MSYLLGLLAMIKCSICSYQCDNWYVSNWRLACHIYFCLGKCALELARRPSHVALALHTAGSSIPFGVTTLDQVCALKVLCSVCTELIVLCRLQLAGITAFTSWRTNLSPFTKGCREWDASMWLPQFLRSPKAPTTKGNPAMQSAMLPIIVIREDWYSNATWLHAWITADASLNLPG